MDHETGEFPNGGNPNTIAAQDLIWEFPATGEYTGNAAGVRTSGVAVNGVKFEPGISDLLVDAYDSGEDLVHIGFAADGFLMYYSPSAAYTSGWELDTESRAGTGCVASGPDGTTIDVEGSTADGTYGSDWVFTDAGELDECNGTTIDGEYAYVVTDTYPFVSRCLNGEVSAEAGGPPPAAGADPQSGPPPTAVG